MSGKWVSGVCRDHHVHDEVGEEQDSHSERELEALGVLAGRDGGGGDLEPYEGLEEQRRDAVKTRTKLESRS